MSGGWKGFLGSGSAAMIGLVLINVFWGASSIASKEALLELTAVEIVTIRFSIALIAAVAVALAFAPGALRVSLRDVPELIFLSVTGISLQFILQVSALVYTTATSFSLLFNLSAIFIMVFGFALLGERPGRRQLIGAGIAFAGVFLIVSGGTRDLNASHLPGDLIGLASAALFGLYSIAAKKAAARFSALTILVYTFFFGVLGLLPLYVFATPMTPPGGLNLLSWGSLLFLALCCSVIAFLVYNYGVGRLPASRAAMAIYVTPLSGVVLAIVLLGETLTRYTIAGAALIMAGLYLTQSVVSSGAAAPDA